MAGVPTNGALAWSALVQLTGASKERLQNEGIEDDDAITLEAGGYTTVIRLKNATRESLERAGLKPAAVDSVLPIIAAATAQPGAAPSEWAQVALMGLARPPSQFKLSTMQSLQNKIGVVLFHCCRPKFVGPPFHLPASLGHQAFGRFRDIMSGRGNAMPTQAAQQAVLALVEVMPRQFNSETFRSRAVFPILEEFLAPYTINEEHQLFQGSGRPDGTIMRGDKRLAVVFEFKNEESPSYLQGQLYISQFVNRYRKHSGTHPVLMVELCGPSIRVCAVFATGTPKGTDVRAIVCEPLTPHQHFFFMPHDPQHMLTLARTLDAIKAAIVEIMEEEDDTRTGCRAPLYTLPYSLRDASKFVNVAHVSGAQYLYTATMLRPQGRSAVGQGLAGDSVAVAGQPEGQEQGQEPGRDMPEGQPVLVKYTAHLGYGEAAHQALAAEGLAPALHSCTKLPGGLVEVIMDDLSPKDGWRSLASLPPASLAQAAPAVLQAVNRMHAVRIKDVQSGLDGPIAHGDLRPPNIMVRQRQPGTDSWCDVEVRFVDFDWACVDGVGTYPAFLNLELSWPSDVAAGEPIMRRHDSEFLGKHLPGVTRGTSTTLPGAPAGKKGRGRPPRASPQQPPQAVMGGQPIASRRVPNQAAVPKPHYPVRCSARPGMGGAQVRLPHTSSCRGWPRMRLAAAPCAM